MLTQFLLINMVIIIGSPKPVIVSRASETYCGPAKIDFGWPDWPAKEKVKHDPCSDHFDIIYVTISYLEQILHLKQLWKCSKISCDRPSFFIFMAKKSNNY